MNKSMYAPIVKILYDERNTFTELVFTLKTVALRDFHGEIVRKHMIPDFVTGFLLLQSEEARSQVDRDPEEIFPPTIQCERLVLTNIDQNILKHFLGYFYERD